MSTVAVQTYVAVPPVRAVVDDGGAEAPDAGVDPGAGDRDSGEVHQELNTAKPMGSGASTGTWESLALRLASVAEKTVYKSTNVPTISAPRPSSLVYPSSTRG